MLYAWEMSGLTDRPETVATDDTAAEFQDGARLGALRTRLETLLPQLDTPADGKLSQWLFERLPLLNGRDVGFVHTLCQNIERVLQRGRSD